MADHQDHHHEHHHHDEGFWRKYIFSVDHKIIGIQYGITSLFFLLVGFAFVLIMRWQLAYPENAIIKVASSKDFLGPKRSTKSPHGIDEAI